MATRDPRDGRTTLPAVVPFDLSPLSRLSWELGARVVDGDDSGGGSTSSRRGRSPSTK
jgi:hypothetical protein